MYVHIYYFMHKCIHIYKYIHYFECVCLCVLHYTLFSFEALDTDYSLVKSLVSALLFRGLAWLRAIRM